MTRDEMLRKMGLTEEQFRNLRQSFGAFYAKLSPEEKKVVDRTLPSLRRAARSLGPDVTENDLRELLKRRPEDNGGLGELEQVLQVILSKTDDDDHRNR
jgi:Ca2+-binding EF-hand superfamily protein